MLTYIPMTEKHQDLLHSWRNSSAVFPYLRQYKPSTIEEQHDWYYGIRNSSKYKFYMVCDLPDIHRVGIDNSNRMLTGHHRDFRVAEDGYFIFKDTISPLDTYVCGVIGLTSIDYENGSVELHHYFRDTYIDARSYTVFDDAIYQCHAMFTEKKAKLRRIFVETLDVDYKKTSLCSEYGFIHEGTRHSSLVKASKINGFDSEYDTVHSVNIFSLYGNKLENTIKRLSNI